MSQEKNKILVVHAGFPKTGTTAIQSYLAEKHVALRASGIGVLSRQGTGYHFALSEYLASLDDRHLKNGYASDVIASESAFPDWTDNLYAYLISDEGLVNIGPNGVRAVQKYADQNGARCHVVFVLRNPKDWIFSLWAQATKIGESEDWIDWLNRALKLKVGFISSALSAWLDLDTVGISLVAYDPTDVLRNFFGHLGIPYDGSKRKSERDSRVNSTIPVMEIMYGAAFNSIVRKSVRKNGSPRLDGEIQRSLLDISDNVRPMFEFAREAEQQLLHDDNLEKSILGYDSFAVLSEYLTSWVHDAQAVFASHNARLHQGSDVVIQSLISQATLAAERLITFPEEFSKLPQRCAVKRVPINSSFISLARSVSYLISKK